jgi:UDP-N-acetylmuramate--alanine ligase
VPFYGFGVMYLDHPEVQALVGRIEDRKVITYGENPQADVRFSNVRLDGTRSIFDVEIRRRRTGRVFSFKDLVLPMPGRHNISNACAAIAVANRLDIPEEAIRKGLAGFGGVKRRFTLTGTANGVQVFDDYGHHPVEIKAVLRAARESCKGRIIAIHQPHRYSRLASLFDDFANCFNDADTIFLSPVYAAGEDPIEGIDSEALVSRIKSSGHRDARYLAAPEQLASLVAGIAQPGDFVVLLGAGNITQWAAALPAELDAISGKS